MNILKHTLALCSAQLLTLHVFAMGSLAQTATPLPPPNSVGTCVNIVSINRIPGAGVLYKPSNVHGGRGPSFLVQNVKERTNKQVIEVRDARCQPIGTFGLFRTDQPYGSRYYSRSGGSGFDDDQLLGLAKRVGSSNILIEGVGKWILVKNPKNREGSVRK